MVYQEVLQPSHARGTTRSPEEYGYRTGVLQSSSGILRVTVSPDQSTVDYIRATLPTDEGGDRKKSAVTHNYSIGPRGAPNADFDPNAKPTKAAPKTGPTHKTP